MSERVRELVKAVEKNDVAAARTLVADADVRSAVNEPRDTSA
jgi:hypothetical protein